MIDGENSRDQDSSCSIGKRKCEFIGQTYITKKKNKVVECTGDGPVLKRGRWSPAPPKAMSCLS